MKKNLIVLSSGDGIYFEPIVKKLRNRYNIKLISNTRKAIALQKAIALEVDYEIFDYTDFKSIEEFNNRLFKYMKNENPDLIALDEYNMVLPEYIINYFLKKIIKIHHSLLPSFVDKDPIKEALEYGVKYTGVTIYYANNELKNNEIIAQQIVKIEKEDTLLLLKDKIHKIGQKLYPKVIDKVIRRMEEENNKKVENVNYDVIK